MIWTEDFSFYLSIVTGLLLTISETLPYINSVKSNGVIQFITDSLLKRLPNHSEEQDQADEENRHLLSSDVSNFVVNSSNVVFTFNSSKVKLEFNGSEMDRID
jgi:hypothetical protein